MPQILLDLFCEQGLLKEEKFRNWKTKEKVATRQVPYDYSQEFEWAEPKIRWPGRPSKTLICIF